jgi:hypothetical protein
LIWDEEMFEMKRKLLDFIENNYIMYDRNVCDYVYFPKSEGKPEGYDAWRERHFTEHKRNEHFKEKQKRAERARIRKAKKLKQQENK